MIEEYFAILIRTIPEVDYSDVISNMQSLKQNSQFAPEYSQKVYETMRAEEQLIGDYTIRAKVFNKTRAQMVNLIEKLC